MRRGRKPIDKTDPRTLTAKQQLFIAEYLKDLNGVAAATRAGYTPASAHISAYQLLRDPRVQKSLAIAQANRLERAEISAERVLTELARLAFSDLRDVFDEKGKMRAPQDWPDRVATAIASVEVRQERNEHGGYDSIARVRTWDKVQALGMLARHLKLLNDTQAAAGGNGPSNVQIVFQWKSPEMPPALPGSVVETKALPPASDA